MNNGGLQNEIFINFLFWFLEIIVFLYCMRYFIKYKKLGKEKIKSVDDSKKEKEKRIYILLLVSMVGLYVVISLALLGLFNKGNKITENIMTVLGFVVAIMLFLTHFIRRKEQFSDDNYVFSQIYRYEYLPNVQLKKGEVISHDEFIPNAIKLALCKQHAFEHADSIILQLVNNNFVNNEELKYKVIESVFKHTNDNIDTLDILERGRHILYICGFKSALLKYIEVFKEELPEDISEEEMNKINAMEDDGLLDIEVNR